MEIVVKSEERLDFLYCYQCYLFNYNGQLFKIQPYIFYRNDMFKETDFYNIKHILFDINI